MREIASGLSSFAGASSWGRSSAKDRLEIESLRTRSAADRVVLMFPQRTSLMLLQLEDSLTLRNIHQQGRAKASVPRLVRSRQQPQTSILLDMEGERHGRSALPIDLPELTNMAGPSPLQRIRSLSFVGGEAPDRGGRGGRAHELKRNARACSLLWSERPGHFTGCMVREVLDLPLKKRYLSLDNGQGKFKAPCGLSFLHVVKDDAIRTSISEGPSRPEVHKVLPQWRRTMSPSVVP